MGTWAEKVRAGAVGLGGVLVPVGIGILDEEGIFARISRAQTEVAPGGHASFPSRGMNADVAIVKGWRADRLGNVEFRGTAMQNQRDLAMAGNYTIVEVNEIVEAGAIDPESVGCPGVFVDAVVQGYSLTEQHDLYRRHWTRLGRLAPL